MRIVRAAGGAQTITDVLPEEEEMNGKNGGVVQLMVFFPGNISLPIAPPLWGTEVQYNNGTVEYNTSTHFGQYNYTPLPLP